MRLMQYLRLSHIVHGPHDEHFHNLWNQLRDEHEHLIRKGYTGEGFLSKGHKLGGSTRIPMHEARRRARAAAERRKTLSAGSGQKLGGAPVRRGQDIRKVIADAATRRATVTKGCASGTSTEREKAIVQETNKNGFRTKAEEEDANEEAIMLAFIDLVQEEEREKYGVDYKPPSKENPWGSQGAPIPVDSGIGPSSTKPKAIQPAMKPPIPASTKPPPTTLLPTRPIPTSPAPSEAQARLDSWTCEVCTLINPSTYLVCDACGTEQPSPPPSPDPSVQRKGNSSTNHKIQNSIFDSNSKKAVRSLMSLDATTSKQPPKPLGWLCHNCDNFMENEWWTCARCGAMKLNS